MEHSGRYGAIDGVASLRKWSINEGYTTQKSVASNTKSGTNRNKGIYDWTGSYSAFGSVPAAMPGETLSLSAYKSPSAAGLTSAGDIFSGTILVTQVAITWDFKTNAPISHEVQFGGDGALTMTTGALITDASTVEEEPPCLGKIVTFSGSETRIPHVTQAVLTFTREAKTSVNSGTSAGSGACLTARRPGAAIDWTLAITTEDGNENTVLASGSILNFRCYVDGTDYWDLKWGLMGQRSGLTVDRESGNIIGQTHNAEMKGFNAGTVGHIKKPGEVTAWWPV